MHQRSCDLCDDTALIHDTLVCAGVVKVRHLCRAHGLKVWRDAVPSPQDSPGAHKKDPVYQSSLVEAAKMLNHRGDADATQT